MPGKRDDRASVVRAQALRLGEEFGLGPHASTHTDKDRPALWGSGCAVLVIATVMIPTAVIPFVDGNPGDFGFGLVWAPVIALIALAGALMTWRGRPGEPGYTHWYADGIVQVVPGEPEPRVVRWDEAVSLSVDVIRSDDSYAYIGSGTLRGRAGTGVTVRGRALVDQGARLLAAPVAGEALRALEAGKDVAFGDMRVGRAGITDARNEMFRDPVTVAWADMRSIDVDARLRVSVLLAGRRGKSLRFDLDTVPNGLFAHYVVERAAAQAGVPVRYSQEKRMPPRLPPVP
jgi:hypothetical protein